MKFERGPQVRIVGNAEEKEKQELAEKQSELLLDPDVHIDQYGPNARENQARFEYPKTEIEKRIIDIANKESNDFLIKYGLKPFDVPEFVIHMVHESDLKKHRDNVQHYASTTEMAIYLNTDSARLNKVAFATIVFHEILHLKSHIALETNTSKEKPKMRGFRSGLMVSPTQANIEKNNGYHEHFRGLNEAVTSDMEKEFMLKVVFNPEKKEFEEEQKWMNSDIVAEAKKKISQKEKIPEDDIEYVNPKNLEGFTGIAYPRQREVYEYVCSEILKQNENVYRNLSDVKEVFRKAYFTGHLLSLAKIFEETFGEGSFRILGNMGDDRKSAISTLEHLKKKRVQNIKETRPV